MENKAYLLLLMADYCHDMDEWIGIYTDTEKLKQDYIKACADLDERYKEEMCGYLKVKIIEFIDNNVDTGKEVSIDELEPVEKRAHDELLLRLAALSEAWKDLIEKTDGKRPDVPLAWSVDDEGILCLDGKWVCPVKCVDVGGLENRELSSLVSHVTIILPLAKGSMDLIITKELGVYEFSIIERMV